MNRNLRIQLADLAEAWLRAARPDLSRERATDLISDWPLAEPWDEETTALVLSRFPAELVPVAGVHFLPPKLECLEANYVNESAAFNGRPFKRWCNCGQWFSDQSYDVASAALMAHIATSRPLVEVTAQPTAEAVDRG